MMKNNRRERSKKSQGQRMQLDALESRVLLTAATGVVTTFANGVISGWAFDADSPTAGLTVKVTVDGKSSIIQADQVRQDGNWGFSTTVGPGTHSVQVFAVDVQTGGPTLIKNGTITNATPTGHATLAVDGTSVTGSAQDVNASGSVVQVEVDVDGTEFQTVTANQTISGQTAGHAFTVTGITSGSVVDVFAIDAPSGAKTLLFTNNKLSHGAVEVLTRTRVKGWVFDPDLGTDPVTVKVLVDGVTVATQVASNPDSTPGLVSLTGTANRGYDIDITSAVGPGTHLVQIIANETGTSSTTFALLGQATFKNPTPVGALFGLTNHGIAGWVGDADAGNSALTVTVKVDGVALSPVQANIAVPQSVRPAGATYVAKGFAQGLSLTNAPHFVQVFVNDAPSGKSTLVLSKVINNVLPFGQLQAFNSAGIYGWAADVNSLSPSTPTKVDILLDGHLYSSSSFVANQTHADLARFPGLGTQHGFNIPMPTTLAGAHTVSVYAVDSFTGQLVRIGGGSFVNHAPVGIASVTSTLISGYAIDSDFPSTALTIIVDVDHVPTSQRFTANINIAGIGRHGFRIPITVSGHHLITVFAIDAGTGVGQLIGGKQF